MSEPKLKSDLTKAEEKVVLDAMIANAKHLENRICEFGEGYSERVQRPICFLDEDPEPNSDEDRALAQLWAIEDDICEAERCLKRVRERIAVYKKYLEGRDY